MVYLIMDPEVLIAIQLYQFTSFCLKVHKDLVIILCFASTPLKLISSVYGQLQFLSNDYFFHL